MILIQKPKTTKNYLLILLSLSIISCSIAPNITNEKTSESVYASNNIHTIKVSEKKGASFLTEINLKKHFNVKANFGTIVDPTPTIKSYQVYLIKSASSIFPAGGDPLNVTNIVSGPNIINATNFSNPTIKFENVPSSTTSFGTGNYYFVAVRAYDNVNATGVEIIANNNGGTAWTGTTATTPKVAVSTGSGIQVLNSIYTVSSNTTLPINIQTTLAGTLPTVDLRVSFSNSLLIGSYSINLCTDPLQPLTTKVLTTPITITRPTRGVLDIGSLSGLPVGTYYAFVQSANYNVNHGANNIVPNATLTGADLNAQVSVSTNSVTVLPNSEFYFSDFSTSFSIPTPLNSGKIFVIGGGNTAGVITSTVGTQNATSVKLNNPLGVAVDNTGNVYITDYSNHLIEKIDTAGKIKVIVGNSTNTGVKPDTTGTQNATAVSLNGPGGMTLDNNNNLYIVDAGNRLIEKIDTAGKIKVIAGNSFTTGVIPDTTGTQNATSVSLNSLCGVAVDNNGNLYITDRGNNNIVEKIDTAGKIKVIAGNSFTTGVIPDTTGTQNATSVSLNTPSEIAVDNVGNVYIADTTNNLIEKIDTNGKIKVIAGNSFTTGVKADTSGTQNATSVSLNTPYGVTIDNVGNIYLDEYTNKLIEKIDTNGKIKVIAGNSSGTGVKVDTSGTQNATASTLIINPYWLAVDNAGNVYINDGGANNLIEVVTP